MPHRGNQGGGRILPHQRNADNGTPTIGASVSLQSQHRDAIVATEKRSMEDKCRKDCRNRIKETCARLEKERPECCRDGTKVLTQAEKEDDVLFYHKNDRDLISPPRPRRRRRWRSKPSSRGRLAASSASPPVRPLRRRLPAESRPLSPGRGKPALLGRGGSPERRAGFLFPNVLFTVS